MSWYEFMLRAARQSKYNARHWFRYLRKVIFDNYSYLTREDVQKLVSSNELTMFQKITLQCAVEKNSPTHEYVVSLNKTSQLPMVTELLKKYEIGEYKHE